MRYSFWAAGPTGSEPAKAGRTIRTLFWHRARVAPPTAGRSEAGAGERGFHGNHS
jgi:hypothetical protein